MAITNKQVKDLLFNIGDMLKPIAKMIEDYGEIEMNAIWLMGEDTPTIDGKKYCRFTEGSRIRIEDGKIISGESNATVQGCYGTINSFSLSFIVFMDGVLYNEPKIVKVK